MGNLSTRAINSSANVQSFYTMGAQSEIDEGRRIKFVKSRAVDLGKLGGFGGELDPGH